MSLKIISGQLLGVPLDVRRGDAPLLSQVIHHPHHLLVNQLEVEDMFIFSQRAGPVPPGEKGQEEKQSGEGP